MSGESLVELYRAVVVGAIVPDVLEQRVRLLHLLVEVDVECAELRHHRASVVELGVVAQTVDTVIAEELGGLIDISVSQAGEHIVIVA